MLSMQTSGYTPFDKDIQDLEASDLATLRQVSEGWYVEYKREVPDASSIAKSISAFANTFGGWLFYGVNEKSKEEPVAGAFPGIPREDVDRVLQRMRQAIAEQVNPSPYFENKVIWGPCEDIDLQENQAIVCVWVPLSPTAPHIHKRGLIFRRVADGSEPRPENDRFALDKLWQRADALKDRYREWHDRDPEFSQSEGKQPYLRLMLVADLWQERGAWLDAAEEDIRATMGMTSDGLPTIPFDTVYTAADGFIGRQLTGNDPHNLTLTWHLRRSLVTDVLIPLPLYTPAVLDSLRADLPGYENIGRFVDFLKNFNFASPRVVDLNYLFNILIGVVGIQRKLASMAKWKHGFYAKAKLLNVWRTVPFVDVPVVLDGFEKFGPPMCLDGSVTSPRGTGPDSFVSVQNHGDLEGENDQVLLQTFNIFSLVARSYGIPIWVDVPDEGHMTPYHVELQKAGHRAIEQQRIRNERSRPRRT